MNGYNFTEHVRQALAIAREEAARLHHEYVGTEHILLAITRVDECCAVLALRNLSIDIAALRASVESLVKAGYHHPTGPDLPYTSSAKKVLELAMSEARDLGHSFVGTEHVLIGLLREERGIAGQALLKSGLTLDATRTEVLRILGTSNDAGEPAQKPKHRRSAGNAYHFTQNVRSVLQQARREAEALHHEYVGTEHLLLALLTETESTAVGVLNALAVDMQAVRTTIIETVKKGKAQPPGTKDLPYTSRAKKVLELAMSEARELEHNYVGTEHLLLGLVREEKGIAAQVLADRGVKLDAARQAVLRLIGERGAELPEKVVFVPLTKSPDHVSEVVVGGWMPHSYGHSILRITLGIVSIVAGAIQLGRLFTPDSVISWSTTLLSAVELTGGALTLLQRTTRAGAAILLGVFAIVIVTRLAQGAWPGPVLVQAAAAIFLLTQFGTSFRLRQQPRT